MIDARKIETAEMPNIDLTELPNVTVGDIFVERPRMTARKVQVNYGDKSAIQDVSLDIGSCEVISFIGPSGLRKINIFALS